MTNARKALAKVKPATIDDIKAGATLWHVYGFRNCFPSKVQLVTGPVSFPVIQAHFEYFQGCDLEEGDFENTWIVTYDFRSGEQKGWKTKHSLFDCGIGSNFNENRLFTTEAEALKYASLLAQI